MYFRSVFYSLCIRLALLLARLLIV